MRNEVKTENIFLFVAALAIFPALVACGGSAPSPQLTAESARDVQLLTVQMETIADEIEAPGTVQSVTTAPVAARVMGTVMSVPVREGDTVEQGQLLVLLDERELAARREAALAAWKEAGAAREEAERSLAGAEAQAQLASKTYERFEFLRKEKSVSPQEFDEVNAKHRAAQAALEAARARRQQVEAMNARAEAEVRAAETQAGYARIVAPFDGVVVQRNVEPGVMAAPGVPLLTLEQASQYRMEVTVPADTGVLRRGSKARVRIDALPEKEMEGTVVELEAGADPSSHTLRVRLELPREAGVRSGLFGRAWFRRGERQALVIPPEAVVKRGQLRGVYVVGANQIVRLRLVTLGNEAAGKVEVLSGLGDGERIVANPGARELDGRKVETQP